jgi:NitT/TauT family transport system substrate-binding protein
VTLEVLPVAGEGVRTLAALLGLALGLVGCSPRRAEVTIPIASWPGYEYFYLARALQLDRPEGVAIRAVEYPDPQAIVHAYLRGELDLAQLTTVEAVDLCSRAPYRCPVVVLVLNESLGGDQLAVRREIGSIAALRGQTVAVTYSTLGPYVLKRALESQGLDLASVKLRNMPMAQMPGALARGEVQAAAIFPPYSDHAARHGQTRVLFDSRSIPGEIFDVLVVAPQFAQRHGQLLPPLLRAWQQAHRQARLQRPKAVGLMAQREQLTPQEFERAEQGLRYFDLAQQLPMLRPGGVIATNLTAVQRVQQRLGLSQPDAPLPAVAHRFVEEALR